ncbi:MAG: MBL fold metallo-hydrolase [Peptococcaceae bacterium]|nr:MBL fold metallo-hydrolase [Peptococcaceae bacterium]
MRITVLGCWAPYPRAGGACSGYLVQDGNANVVIDLGNGSFSSMVQLFDFRTVRAVLLTHLHPDHMADLECFRHAIEGAIADGSRAQGPVTLVIPNSPKETAEALAKKTKAFRVVYIEELPWETVPLDVEVRVLELGNIRYYFLPVRHSIPAYAVGVDGSGYFVFSGDTAPMEELALFAHRADIFMCEASGLDKDEEKMKGNHMTARQAGILAEKAKAKQLIITHFWPEYNQELLKQQAEEGYGQPVELAQEGHTYFIY